MMLAIFVSVTAVAAILAMIDNRPGGLFLFENGEMNFIGMAFVLITFSLAVFTADGRVRGIVEASADGAVGADHK